MPCRLAHGNIGQLLARLNASEHEPSTTHVSPTYEFGGKNESSAKDIDQRVHIFWRCNAAQKHNLAARASYIG